ncbi:MAG: leucyl/phenylalanyl-tRNA--protein transferase [Micavibrio sp.]|nr:leucyl/phenylalanyl-tRNA--protein transferase [Micavibrio sp.]|tara:strand:- start:1937 stop:2611 length:675 start_codon:yes stop_codon:yes gene_type:complete
MQLVLTNELLLEAYRQGLFPMAYNFGSPVIHWVCPELRGQLSIPHMHIPRSLRKDVRKALKNPAIQIKINTAFERVIALCGETTDDRPETWINTSIKEAFINLHKQGHAHSVEYWQNGDLLGGLYGLSIGATFCGESMFSRTPNASKIALVHLVARLWAGGYQLLDTQFTNDHLEQFGVYEVPHEDYIKALNETLNMDADFTAGNRSEEDIITDYFAMRARQTL